MSGSGRHSSYESPYGGRGLSSYAYVDQAVSDRQYLSPEDIYRLERDGTYFNSYDYPHSRHGSDSNSPRHSDIIPPDKNSRHQSKPHSPYVEYPYTDLSRNSTSGSYNSYSPKRVTPPLEAGTASRHVAPESYSGHAKHRAHGESGSIQSSPKGKGKARDNDSHSDPPRKSSSRREQDNGGNASSRRTVFGPSQQRLVSGVFIRY